MNKRKKEDTMTEVLRDAITNSGVTLAELGRQTGVFRQTLTLFVRGEQTIELETADKLAAYFGIRVVRPKQRKAK